MSEKELVLVERVAKMPDALKDKFLAMAEGAAIALESMREEEDDGKDSEGA